jgi:bifunctional non-homologous end joining protein LigD
VDVQLATLVSKPPGGAEWLHEIKLDGYRIVARVEDREVALLSRNRKDWTARFPAVRDAVAGLGLGQAILDGEVVVLRPDGTTSFQSLQNVLSGGADGGTLAYYAFDLLYLEGRDVRPAALADRKAALRSLLHGGSERLRYSDHVAGTGPAFLAEACQRRLEGIVSKRADAPYQAGRGTTWLKVKCARAQEVVVGGFTPPEGARTELGALLLGVHDERGALRYAGKVGTGFSVRTLQDLRRRLRPLETKASPFTGTVPEASRAHWVRPELVAEVTFGEWTDEGRLRHTSFKGLREDKAPREVVREQPRPEAAPPPAPAGASPPSPPPARASRPAARRVKADGAGPRRRSRGAPDPVAADDSRVAGVRLTHPDRVLFPDLELTKRDLALFYEAVADRMLPHLRDRPLALVRCPRGVGQPCFFARHAGAGAGPALRRVPVPETGRTAEALAVDDVAGLIGLVQMSVLEIHPWGATTGSLERPDRLVLDLDPGPGVAFPAVMEAARTVRDALKALGLTGYVRTTGSRGLHVVAPLRPRAGWEACHAVARRIASAMVAQAPDRYTLTISKAARAGKIFLDDLRNRRGNTAIASYSTRARPGAPVATPLHWDELERGLRSDRYTVTTLPRRLARLRADPWAGFAASARPLPDR